jgi:hypothetical protein
LIRNDKMLLLLIILIISSVGESYTLSLSSHLLKPIHKGSSSTRLFSSSCDDGNDQIEETLMQISLSINEGYNTDDVISVVQQYLSSFPFSAVLPVQPLTYTPKNDGMGVDVYFLRKKTEEKGSKDGGIQFTFDICMEEEEEGQTSSDRVNIVAKRVSEGQVISKVFSEGMIIKSFVSGLNNGESNEGRVGIGYDKLSTMCSVESMFHKWM